MKTLWRLMMLLYAPARTTRNNRHTVSPTSILAVLAFATTTAMVLTVLSGLHAFMLRAKAAHAWDALTSASSTSQADPLDLMSGIYVTLAIFACLILLVPIGTLGGAAARLAAHRRDAQLSALRLAGATSMQVTWLTAVVAAGQALTGSIFGIIGYIAAMPIIKLLRFQNREFTWQELWLGIPTLLLVVLVVTVLALCSALLALHRVIVSPLSVSNRTTPSALRHWRAWLMVILIALSIGLFRSPWASSALGIAFIMIMITACFAVLNTVGPWVIHVSARRMMRHPSSAAHLIALGRVLDDPKRAWRNIAGVALAVFVCGITALCAFFASDSGNDITQQIFLHDIGLGGNLTLAFATILAAVSCAIAQVSAVFDAQREYRTLVLSGTDMRTLDRARLLEVWLPLRAVVLVSIGCVCVLLFPLVGAVVFMQPITLIAFAFGIVLSMSLVLLAVTASHLVAHRVVRLDRREDD
ncbi:transporter [Galliscardovia ingluviei]|uniref:Transporter n=1 Tax=Galliscardovia ingluviei TaxID=1769422 RepID=A0A8J3AG55_9BIFI|nr:ABC transporter permease [Galliscardovia ingluviei]GGI13708.1 transporter [Galliscardovia ingluviei]